MAKGHGVSSTSPVGLADAEHVARVMSALATSSRVRILAHLRRGPSSVGGITAAVEMAQPAVSHQLRILRDLGLVVGNRQGRNTVYGLNDAHVRSLLDEALRHIQHRRTGDADALKSQLGEHDDERTSEAMTDQHTHESAHLHEHEHADTSHEHPHTSHEHEHVEHEHDHSHGSDTHAHEHVHQAGQEEEHAHRHE